MGDAELDVNDLCPTCGEEIFPELPHICRDESALLGVAHLDEGEILIYPDQESLF
mgnify:CR=1 FL=1